MRIKIPYWRHVKRYLPRTLFWRSFMIIIVPAMLLQIIVCFIFLDRHWTAMSERLAAAVARETSIILAEFNKLKANNTRVDKIQNKLNEIASMTGMRILYKSRGSLSGANGKIGEWFDTAPFLITELKKIIDNDFVVAMHPRQRKWIKLQIDLKENGLLIVEMPERRLLSATSYIFVLWMLGSSFVLFTIAMLFMKNQIRPIRRLSVAVERFGRGEDVPYFRPEGAVEVRQAGSAFLKMRARIKRQIEQRTAMLVGISHDLRTPVTRMKIEIEMLDDKKTVAGLRSDLEEMEKMLDGYLSFARGEEDEKQKLVYLDELLQNIVNDAQRQGLDIKIKNKMSRLKCRAKPVSLARAINNIIVNGCKYGSRVILSATEDKNELGKPIAKIEIEDSGKGIPEDMLEDVLKPFFRLEKSRNPKTGGVGLGLSIAQDIINAHGGRIELNNKKSGNNNSVSGLIVSVFLPL